MLVYPMLFDWIGRFDVHHGSPYVLEPAVAIPRCMNSSIIRLKDLWESPSIKHPNGMETSSSICMGLSEFIAVSTIARDVISLAFLPPTPRMTNLRYDSWDLFLIIFIPHDHSVCGHLIRRQKIYPPSNITCSTLLNRKYRRLIPEASRIAFSISF